MNLFALSGLLAFICAFIFGIFSWVKGKKFLNKIWSVFNFSVAIWGLGAFKFSTTMEQEAVFFWLHLGHIGVILIPVFFIHFVFELLDIKKRNVLWLTYGIGLMFFVLNITDWLSFTNIFIVNLRYVFDSFYVDSPPGLFYPFFVSFFFIVVVYAHYLGFKRFENSSGLKRMQLKYFLLATAIGFFGGGTAFPMVFGLDVYPLLHFTLPLYPVIMTYAIFKYRLMDIKLAVTRGTLFGSVYILLLSIPFLLYFFNKQLLINNFGSDWPLVPITIAVILGSLGPGIYSKLKNKAEWALFKQQKQYQETLMNLGTKMTLTKDIEELLSYITRTITTNVGISYTRIFLWDENRGEYLFKKGYGKERRKQYKIKLDEESAFVQYLKAAKAPVLKDEVINDFKSYGMENYQEVKKYIRNTGAELIVPAFIKDKMIGFMTLGIKDNNNIYTPEDINMFRILSGQAALAIENAQFYEKVKESEARLIQASKMSSIGQMAAGFAHNINNPFNSIMVNADYIRMLIEESEGKPLDEEQREELKESLRAIMQDSESGGSMVRNIRDFSKPSSGEMKTINLNEVLKESLKLAETRTRVSKAEVDFDIDEKLIINGDKNRLEQVFMNILINASDAVADKEEKKIKVRTEKKDNGTIEVKISDTGGGIDEKDMPHIFDYFFTTKRNEGAGLGLALAYQITRSHGGIITAENSEKGAVFTVILPIMELWALRI
ncbi:MAG: ATP-binding protein [Elusimicrobiota bacterium]